MQRPLGAVNAAGNESVTAAWGNFLARSSWADIPASVRHEAKRSLLNAIGTSLGAASHPDVDRLIRLVAGLAGAPRATVFGRSERLDILNSAFVNAISANLLDFDDTHLETVIHPTAPVAPPLFALAEERGLAGPQLLHAFVLGVEIACRLGNAVSPGHYARGLHITATCGVFGAAAGCAKLLGLDAHAIAHAIGIAASQSAGIVESLATDAKSFGVGNAARNGLLAAIAAEAGCTAAPAAIEGPQGWAHAFGDELKRERLLDALGETWEIARNTYKPYPCGIVLHPVIDACFDLRRTHALAADDIEAVSVAGHPLLLARADRPVGNERDAKISIHHSVAAVFLLGAAGVREFSEPLIMEETVAAFRARVHAEVDPAMPVGAARVSATAAGGKVFTAEVMHARGSLALPMTDAEIAQKLRDLAAAGCPSCEADRVIEAVWALDQADDLRTLMRLVAAG
ncbi:MAG TPA: MmgE/PrpD family protein [Xanthobacteraceae bacterium]|jgi:2-methylcitrate dehydratase PrpD